MLPTPRHARAPQDPSNPSAEEVAATLREVLARPEFQRVEETESVLGRLYRSFLEWLARNAVDLPSLPGGTLVNVLAIAALVVVAALLARFLVRHRARRGTRGGRAAAVVSAETADARSAEEWEARARDLAAAGHVRDAALALYQAVVRRLSDAGAVRYHVSKTPGEYRREVRGQDVARRYAAFLSGFEPVAFGPDGDAGADMASLFSLARDAAPGHA